MKEELNKLRVRVSAESDGYREATRTSVVELAADAVEVEMPLPKAAQASPLGKVIPFIALLSATPFLVVAGVSWIKRGPDIVTAFFGLVALITAAAFLIPGWRQRSHTSERRDDLIPRAAKPQTRPVRPAQALVLVGRVQQDADGTERTIARIRVEPGVEDNRSCLVAEYDDGTRAHVLREVTADEAEELRACITAHEIPVE